MKPLFIIYIFIFIFSIQGNSQDLNLDYELSSRQLSPQAAQFSKFGNTPIKNFVGEVDLSIPLYVYEDRDFTIPITLQYNGNGFMPNKNEGIVGLDWSLNVGGAITRKINGAPDESSESTPTGTIYGLLYSSSKNVYKYDIPFNQKIENTSIEALGNAIATLVGHQNPTYPIALGGGDLAPDIFNFTMPGHGGSFNFNWEGKAICGGSKPYQITFSNHYMTSSKTSQTFTITSPDGYQYIFGGDEDCIETSAFFPDGKNVANQKTVISAWFLKKIIAPNNRTVDFIYKSAAKLEHSPVLGYHRPHESIILQQRMPGTTQGRILANQSTTNAFSLTNSAVTYELIKQVYLEKIVIDDMTITFSYKEKGKSFYSASDFPQNSSPFNTFNVKTLQLSGITAQYNKSIIKSISLQQEYLGSTDGTRLFLTSLTSGADKYSFDYYNLDKMPNPTRMQDIDHWGYYNAKTMLVPDFVPQKDGTSIILDTQEGRVGDEECSKVGMLRRVIYPTGGGSLFYYDLHSWDYLVRKETEEEVLQRGDFAGPPPTSKIGGARIQKIEDFDDNGNITVTRKFLYKNGILLRHPNYLKGTDLLSWPGGYIYLLTCYTNPIAKDNYPSEKYIQYAEVTESILNGGYTTYKYTSYLDKDNRDVYDLSSSAYLKSGGVSYTNWFPILDMRGTDRSYRRGLLTEKAFYNKNSDIVYKEITKYETQTSSESNYIRAISHGDFVFSKFKIENYAYLPTEVKRYEYRDGKQIISTNQMLYNESYFIKQQTDVENNIVTQYKYPNDFKTITPYSEMITKNIINPLLGKQVNKSNSFLYEQTNTYSAYDFNGSKLYLCSETYSKNRGETSSVLHTKFNNYDALGNPISITTKDNVNKVYLWGYKGLYPIAEIINSTYSEVKTALGQEPNSFYTAATPDTTKIESLRSKLSNSSITTTLYYPFSGVKQVKNPRNIYSYYKYDDNNRLIEIKDNNNNILSAYAYNQTPYSPLDIWVSVSDTHSFRYPLKMTASANGGSGSYTYSWYVKDSAGTILAQQLNSTTPSFTYQKFKDVGLATISCILKDTKSGKTKEFSKTIEVIIPKAKLYLPLSAFANATYLNGSDLTSTVDIQDGSGEFIYNWYLKDEAKQVLSKQENSASNSFTFTFSKRGIMELVCQVKDTKTNKVEEISHFLDVWSILLVMKSGNDMIDTVSNMSVDVTGGSGNYQYNWTMKELGKDKITSQYQGISPDNKFSVKLTQFGIMEVVCKVKDLTKGSMEEITKSFKVVGPPVYFSNVKSLGTSATYSALTADIDCYEACNIKFSLAYNGIGGSASLQVGSTSYQISTSGTKSLDIAFPKGITTVTFRLNRQSSASGVANATLIMEDVTGNSTLGIDRILNLAL